MSTTLRKLSPSLSLIDETADLKQGKRLHLQLLAGPGAFSFSLLNSEQRKFVALESYNLQNVFTSDSLVQSLDQIISGHAFLKGSFSGITFAYDSHRSTLVPEALYDADSMKSYIDFNHKTEPGDLVLSDQLKSMDTRNIYLFPGALRNLLTRFYPNVTLRHHSSSLLESLAMLYKNESKPKLVLHISLTHFEIIFFEGKHLRFYNTFRHQTTEDFIYYLLFVCEQLKLNPETLELVLIGEIERNSAIYSMLLKYVRNVRFGERPEAFTYCHPMSTIPKHFYCNLFSQELFN
jgi:hypothetical protein